MFLLQHNFYILANLLYKMRTNNKIKERILLIMLTDFINLIYKSLNSKQIKKTEIQK